MPSRKYKVSVRADSVDAQWESTPRSILLRIIGILGTSSLAAAWVYFVVFRQQRVRPVVGFAA